MDSRGRCIVAFAPDPVALRRRALRRGVTTQRASF